MRYCDPSPRAPLCSDALCIGAWPGVRSRRTRRVQDFLVVSSPHTADVLHLVLNATPTVHLDRAPANAPTSTLFLAIRTYSSISARRHGPASWLTRCQPGVGARGFLRDDTRERFPLQSVDVLRHNARPPLVYKPRLELVHFRRRVVFVHFLNSLVPLPLFFLCTSFPFQHGLRFGTEGVRRDRGVRASVGGETCGYADTSTIHEHPAWGRRGGGVV